MNQNMKSGEKAMGDDQSLTQLNRQATISSFLLPSGAAPAATKKKKLPLAVLEQT